jgi:hypothetical protein
VAGPLEVAQEVCRTVGEFLYAIKKLRVNESSVDQKIAAFEAKDGTFEQQMRAK